MRDPLPGDIDAESSAGFGPICPLPVIGVVHTERISPQDTPVQAALNRGEQGVIDIRPEFAEGLSGLADFDYAWLLSWLHEAQGPPDTVALTQVPFFLSRQQRRIGVFAMRGPKRINPIGLSLIRIVEVNGSQVRFDGVDLIDGTSVIDLKPYVTSLDRPPGEPRCGWYDTVPLPEAASPADLARPEES